MATVTPAYLYVHRERQGAHGIPFAPATHSLNSLALMAQEAAASRKGSGSRRGVCARYQEPIRRLAELRKYTKSLAGPSIICGANRRHVHKHCLYSSQLYPLSAYGEPTSLRREANPQFSKQFKLTLLWYFPRQETVLVINSNLDADRCSQVLLKSSR